MALHRTHPYRMKSRTFGGLCQVCGSHFLNSPHRRCLESREVEPLNSLIQSPNQNHHFSCCGELAIIEVPSIEEALQL